MKQARVGGGLMGETEEEAAGCRFCKAKGVQYDLRGREWWHPSVNCCGPSALLQVTWRRRDLDVAKGKLERAPAGAEASHRQVLIDVEEDARDAVAAFRRFVTTEAQLQEAIAAVRSAGFSDPWNWSAARIALHRTPVHP